MNYHDEDGNPPPTYDGPQTPVLVTCRDCGNWNIIGALPGEPTSGTDFFYCLHCPSLATDHRPADGTPEMAEQETFWDSYRYGTAEHEQRLIEDEQGMRI